MGQGSSDNKSYPEVIALLPAGGHAVRISPSPCSKEVYPIGLQTEDEGRSYRPKVVCQYLLKEIRLAGITKAYIILRKGKWDIPTYLGDGSMLHMHLAYLIMGLPYGVPYTIDQAYPFVQDAVVAFGFPDVIFETEDAFSKLLKKQTRTKADIVLGLFPAKRPQHVDMVDHDSHGQVHDIIIKPPQTDLCYTWVIALWSSVFTRFMHEYLKNTELVNRQKYSTKDVELLKELTMGDVIQAAIKGGLCVQSVLFPDKTYVDIGSPEGLVEAVRNFGLPPEPRGESP